MYFASNERGKKKQKDTNKQKKNHKHNSRGTSLTKIPLTHFS